jgi:hypothetical protein
MNDNEPKPIYGWKYKKALEQYIREERAKLDIKPYGMMGNWAFALRKEREFKAMWDEAWAKEKDDSFE